MARGSVKDIDHGWKRITREIGAAKGAHAAVGVLSNAGTYEDEGAANLADVATWNEFGTRSIPERPFMRQAFDSNQAEIKTFIAQRYSMFLEGKISMPEALKTLGAFFTGKVQEIFTKGHFAPNAPSTILGKTVNGKKGTTPLIDTGRLRQSINFEVREK